MKAFQYKNNFIISLSQLYYSHKAAEKCKFSKALMKFQLAAARPRNNLSTALQRQDLSSAADTSRIPRVCVNRSSLNREHPTTGPLTIILSLRAYITHDLSIANAGGIMELFLTARIKDSTAGYEKCMLLTKKR